MNKQDSWARTALLVLGVVMVVTGSMGVVLAAAPTVDTETTETNTQSDLTDGTTINGFEANGSNETRVEAKFDSDKPKIEFQDPDTNEVLLTLDSDDLNETNSSQNYYGDNLSHDEFSQFPMAPGENKSITVQFINNTNPSNPDTTNITVYFENSQDRGVVYVGESLASGNDVEIDSDGFTVLNRSFFANEYFRIEHTVESGGSNATTTFALANTSVADRVSQSHEDATREEWVSSTLMTVDGEPVRVYDTTAPDDVANGSSTYAVYRSSTNEIVLHYRDDYSAGDQVDVVLNANKGYIAQFRVYGVQLPGKLQSVLQGMPFVLSGLALIALGMPIRVRDRRDTSMRVEAGSRFITAVWQLTIGWILSGIAGIIAVVWGAVDIVWQAFMGSEGLDPDGRIASWAIGIMKWSKKQWLWAAFGTGSGEFQWWPM